MKLMFCIPTFNRRRKLNALVRDIRERYPDADIVVVDDHSDPPAHPPWVTQLYRTPENNGKSGYWKTINILFSHIEKTRPSKVVFLADDLEIVGNIDEAISETGRIAMNLLTDRRGIRPQWINRPPRKIGHTKLWDTGWIDGAFVAPLGFFNMLKFRIEPIPADRWKKNPLLGSGVWEQVSHRARYHGWRMLHHEEGWLRHADDGISKMNPQERKLNPL